MSRWHAMLEYFQFPLKMLFIATILLGIGSSIINPNVDFLWEVNSHYIIVISEILRYTGGFLIRLFPLLVFLKALTRRFEDSTPVFVGFVSYIIITIIILFLQTGEYPSYFYGNLMGIQMDFDANSIFGAGIRMPYATGIVTLLLAYFITNKAYKKSRHYAMHGLLSFIDHDTWSLLITLMFSVISGVLVAYGWPYIIQVINVFYEYISRDSSNPMNMFLYGVMERISAMFGMGEIPREAFWFTQLGGEVADNFGVLYSGDVNTWFAYLNLGITTSNAGHLITPYYVINMFLIPGFLIAYYTLVTSKKDRHRYLIFFVIALLFSIVCGNALPMEIFMLVLSPLLYVVYIFTVGILFATFQILGVSIGYAFNGSVMVANPGSLLDLFQFFRNPDMIYALSAVAFVGFLSLIFFFIITRGYFKYFAIGLFSMSDKKAVSTRVVHALGGIENITSIESSPDKITIGLLHRDAIDIAKLRDEGAYLILESKEGYLIRLGNISTIIASEIKKMRHAYEKINS